MPFLGQEDHSVSPPPSPASCSPPLTASWLALPMNWQSQFCLSSPACWHLGFWMERGIAAPCPWQGTIILSLWLWSQEQRWEACLLTHASTCPGNHLVSMSHSLIDIYHREKCQVSCTSCISPSSSSQDASSAASGKLSLPSPPPLELKLGFSKKS